MVPINLIYDSNANLYDSKGNLLPIEGLKNDGINIVVTDANGFRNPTREGSAGMLSNGANLILLSGTKASPGVLWEELAHDLSGNTRTQFPSGFLGTTQAVAYDMAADAVNSMTRSTFHLHTTGRGAEKTWRSSPASIRYDVPTQPHPWNRNARGFYGR